MMTSGLVGKMHMHIKQKQLEAKEDHAPDDVVYKDINGKWHRFEDVESENTKKRVQSIVDQMK